MKYVIGTYREKGKVAALKTYNSETGEIRLDPKSAVFENAKLGEIYIGLEQKVNSKGEEVIDITKFGVNVLRLDEVDENGNPIDDRQARLVLATKGYGSSTQVTVVDSMGKIETLCYDVFSRLLDEKRIVGARRKPYNHIEFHKLAKREGLILSNKEEESHHE